MIDGHSLTKGTLMNPITRSATALTLTLTAFTAAASWDEVKEAANGDYYTAVDSSNVEANELAVYFSAERQCSPQIILFDYQSLEAEDVARWDQVTGERFDSMIDLNVASVAHSSDNSPAFLVFDYYRLDSGAYFGIVKIEITPDDGIIDAFKNGDVVTVRFQIPSGDWSTVHKYGLGGASRPLKEAEMACRGAMAVNGSISPTPRTLTLGATTLFYL